MKGESRLTRKELVIRAKDGLRGRNVELFTGVAARFKSQINVEGKGKDKIINAKSILGVLSLMVKEGESITVVASGDDAHDAIKALSLLVESNFQNF